MVLSPARGTWYPLSAVESYARINAWIDKKYSLVSFQPLTEILCGELRKEEGCKILPLSSFMPGLMTPRSPAYRFPKVISLCNVGQNSGTYPDIVWSCLQCRNRRARLPKSSN